MAVAARVDLEALLRARKLDRTLTSTLCALTRDESLIAPVGISALDDRLGGGIPRGQLSEIVGPRSSGRTSLLMTTLGAATGRGELVALVDTFDMFDPPSAAAAGVDLSRLLWIRGEASSGTMGAERAVDRALKGAGLVLEAAGFGVVALDLIDAPVAALRRLPFTTWMRLQRVIEGRATVCLVLADEPIARSAGGVTLALDAHRPVGVWSGQDSPRLFSGLAIEARVARARIVSNVSTVPLQFEAV